MRVHKHLHRPEVTMFINMYIEAVPQSTRSPGCNIYCLSSIHNRKPILYLLTSPKEPSKYFKAATLLSAQSQRPPPISLLRAKRCEVSWLPITRHTYSVFTILSPTFKTHFLPNSSVAWDSNALQMVKRTVGTLFRKAKLISSKISQCL